MKTARPQTRELPWWVLLFPLATIVCWVAGFIHASRTLRPPEDLALFHFVRGTVVRNYVERKEPEQLLYQGLAGMMSSLDRHSRFFPPAQAQRVREESSGSYQGIGVVVHGTRPFPLVFFPMAGSPGEKAGILPGDRILAVDGRSIEGLVL